MIDVVAVAPFFLHVIARGRGQENNTPISYFMTEKFYNCGNANGVVN